MEWPYTPHLVNISGYAESFKFFFMVRFFPQTYIYTTQLVIAEPIAEKEERKKYFENQN